jgi:hypothetical protein
MALRVNEVFFFQYPELLLASYNSNEESPHDPDGVALLWNMKFKKTTPEYVFHWSIFCPTIFDSSGQRRNFIYYIEYFRNAAGILLLGV